MNYNSQLMHLAPVEENGVTSEMFDYTYVPNTNMVYQDGFDQMYDYQM